MSILDQAIVEFDRALRTLAALPRAHRPSPGGEYPEAPLSSSQRQQIARLMRINHTGEICAQALYQGQSWTARLAANRAALQAAAREEEDHLAWCYTRIQELGGRTSLLNPLWYTASLALGVLAGVAGEHWNLAFLEETERQVEGHLAAHLAQIPEEDQRTRAVVEQMKTDEMGHAELARRLGAAQFPTPVKVAMKWSSRLMTRTVYWV